MTRRARISVGLVTVAVIGLGCWAVDRNHRSDLFAPVRSQVSFERTALLISNGSPRTKTLVRAVYLRGARNPEIAKTLGPALIRAGFDWRHPGLEPEDEEFYKVTRPEKMIELMEWKSRTFDGVVIWERTQPTWFDEAIGRVASIGRDPYVSEDNEVQMSKLLWP